MNEHSALDVDIKHAWTYLSRIWTAYKKVTKDILPRKAGTKPPKAETLVKRKRAALKFMVAEVRLQLDQPYLRFSNVDCSSINYSVPSRRVPRVLLECASPL